MTTSAKITIKDIPTGYDDLVRFFSPRPIRDDVDLDNVVEIIDAMAGHQLTQDQEDYMDLLATLVEEHERRTVRFPRRRGTPLQRLKFLMKETGMSTADLGRLLGNSGLASQVLNGRRELSKTHIRKLAARFKVSPGLFL